MALIRRRGAAPAEGPDAHDSPAPELDVEQVPGSGGADGDPAALPASRMRGTESLYGYVVGLELLVVAVLNTVITTGKGAPAHPQTGLQMAGIAAAALFFAVLQVRNRTIVGFAAIVAAFFVTLPKVPSSLAIPHVLALAGPLVYGLIISQRQRRALGGSARGRRARAGGDRGRATAGDRTSARNRAPKQVPSQPGAPRPNARYTPPKARRGPAKNQARGRTGR